MFLGTILTFITLYQKRHMAPSPMRIYSFSALLILINTLPLSGLSDGFEIWFWGAIFLLMAYLMIFGSIYLYYEQEYDINSLSFKGLIRKLKNIRRNDIPKLTLIILINSFTLGMYIFATITQPNFTDWLLGVCIINLIIYFLYYFILKIKNKEPINKLIYVWLLLDIVILSLSIVFFFIAVTDKFLPMKESNELNKPCVLFNYFDYHDIWHILSAIGLFIFMLIIFFLDSKNNDTLETIVIF